MARRQIILTKGFREFPQFVQANSRIVPQIRPRPLVPLPSDPLFATISRHIIGVITASSIQSWINKKLNENKYNFSDL